MWVEASATDREKRLDQFLRERLPQYSRSRLQDWIEQGRVLVDGSPVKRSHLLKGAERIHVQPGELAPLKATPEDLPLEVLYEDADVIAVNKPAGVTSRSRPPLDLVPWLQRRALAVRRPRWRWPRARES